MNKRKIRDDKNAENAVMSPSASGGVDINISAMASLSSSYTGVEFSKSTLTKLMFSKPVRRTSSASPEK